MQCPSFAAEIIETNNNVRALGMGNAFAPIVDDKDALFYNPAGLGKIKGIAITVMDPHVGIDGADVANTLRSNATAGSSGNSFANTLKSLMGKNVWIGTGAKTALAVPGFALAAYDNVELSSYLENPAFPNLNMRYTNDIGFAVGLGLDAGGVFQWGLSGQRITRQGGNLPVGMSTLGSLSNNDIINRLNNRGTGYAASTGINVSIPSPIKPTFSLVWKNLGQTQFIKDSDSTTAPPSIPDDMVGAFAFTIDLPLLDINTVFEMKHMNNPNEQLGKKLHMGMEFDLPIAAIRAGFNQGYYTLGAGIDLAIFRLDVATYGVELGEYPGQMEDRRYLVQFTVELGFDPNFNFLGGGGSGGTGAKRGIKQRR